MGLVLAVLGILAFRPAWVARTAEGYVRDYLAANPLADSARIEFASLEWVSLRGIRLNGLHVHRGREGVRVGRVELMGLGWSDGGPRARVLRLDSVAVTGIPSGSWLQWFEPWTASTDTSASPTVLAVDTLALHFWANSVEGDTLVAPSSLRATHLSLRADGLRLAAELDLKAPAVGVVHASVAVAPEQSELSLAYQNLVLDARYTDQKINLKLEDDSINKLNLNILKNNDSWKIPRQVLEWDGVELAVAGDFSDEPRLDVEGFGLALKLRQYGEEFRATLVGDSARAADAWHVHGRAAGRYAQGAWNVESQDLRIKAAGQRFHVPQLRADGGSSRWSLRVREAQYGSLEADGDYAGADVRARWSPNQPIRPLKNASALHRVDARWSADKPFNASLVLRDSLGEVGGLYAAVGRDQAWSVQANFSGYQASARFNRTPEQWSVPTLELHQWLQQALAGRPEILDSLGLASFRLEGPDLRASVEHDARATRGSAVVATDDGELTWLYSATARRTEHRLDWSGAESAQLTSVAASGDSLRLELRGFADHARGGRAELALAVWPYQSTWTGRMEQGSVQAWYRPESGDSLSLKGALSGASSMSYSFDQQRFVLDDPLFWNSPQGRLAVGGALSPNEGEVLRVQARDVDIPFWSRVAGLSAVDLAGQVSLDAVVVGQLSGWAVSGGIETQGLRMKGQDLGTLILDLDYVPDARRSEVNLRWNRLDTVILAVTGHLDESSFSATTTEINLPVRWARPFADGAVDDLNGRIKGRVKLAANADFSDLTWSGSGYWSNAHLKLPSVGLGLTGSSPWALSQRDLRLGPARWADHRGVGSAEIQAQINLTGSELVDLRFKTERMVVMDLPPNPDFYGYVVGSGQGRLRGTAQALRLDVAARTADSSVFVLPLDAPVSLDEVEFLHFRSRETAEAPRRRVRSSDAFRFDLHLDLDVTPDVLARLILDETVGDVIEARGAGPLQLDVPWVGDMALRGNLALQRGTYLFTLQNLINKPFSLLPGGTLNWTGDPYGAQMDLTAVYKTRADLRDYLSLPEAGRQNVDVTLHATGPLFQPQLAFGIALPNAGELAQAALSSRLAYPDERTTQVLSLLTISSFWVGSSPLAAQGMQAVESNTTQVLASQFTNFVTQGLGSDWDVNLAYSANSAAAQREMEASIGRSFLDDRLSIQTEWGIPIGQSQPSIGLGDVEVRYQLSEDGRWSAKAYQRRNDQNTQSGVVGSQRQGVGLRWEQSGMSWKDVLRRGSAQ